MATLKFRKEAYKPHQWQFLTSQKKIKALVSGLGGGKTYIFLRETLKQHIFNKDPKTGRSNGWIIYPTYALAEELFINDFLDMLNRRKIRFEFRSQHKTIDTKYGRIRIYQLQKPHRMVGSNLTYIGFDEFDIESAKNCRTAYEKGIGRMRGCANPCMYFVTTPEGFHETYRIFVKEANDEKELIQASTYDNKDNLPEGYIETLMQEYDEKLAEGYILGKFTNLTSGSVYYGFNRGMHVDLKNSLKFDESLAVCLCVDFNVNPMVWELVQYRDRNDIRVIKEICGKNTNTFDMCRRVKEVLPARQYDLIIYGDASGYARDTRSLQTDYSIIEQELREHFKTMQYKVPVSNPPVRARIHAMNARLGKNNIRINAQCVELIDDLEQVVYDKHGDIEKSDFKRTHGSDAFGYLAIREFPIIVDRKKPIARIK